MFIIETFVAASSIHGIGVFAGQNIGSRQPIWKFKRGLDLVVPFAEIAAAPLAFQNYMQMYAYVSLQIEGGMILSCDHAKFLNHSDEPNTVIQGETTYAARAIRRGEEITCDYRICCANWDGSFDN